MCARVCMCDGIERKYPFETKHYSGTSETRLKAAVSRYQAGERNGASANKRRPYDGI